MRELHILNLGAGVQSTTLYLMSLRGELPDTSPLPEHVCAKCEHLQDGMGRPCEACGSIRVILRHVAESQRGEPYERERPPIRFDYAIFADTQEEPQTVYEHLAWLKRLGGPPIVEATAGKLGDDLIAGRNSTGGRFASIPAYTLNQDRSQGGRVPRQCTREYKTEVVERVIRRSIFGLEARARFPRDVKVILYLGLSFDEPNRVVSVKARFQSIAWAQPRFPLFDLEMTRRGCVSWLERHYPGRRVARSGCVFCPFNTNAEWRLMRDLGPQGWERACAVDEGLRAEGAVVNRGLDRQLFLHRSGEPLREAPIDTPESRGEQRTFGFAGECEGMCGL